MHHRCLTQTTFFASVDGEPLGRKASLGRRPVWPTVRSRRRGHWVSLLGWIGNLAASKALELMSYEAIRLEEEKVRDPSRARIAATLGFNAKPCSQVTTTAGLSH